MDALFIFNLKSYMTNSNYYNIYKLVIQYRRINTHGGMIEEKWKDSKKNRLSYCK